MSDNVFALGLLIGMGLITLLFVLSLGRRTRR
jgi:hypothetical protein